MNENEGYRVRTAREKKGMTQVKMAQAMGIHPNTISNWETEKTPLRGANRLAVANLLEVSVEYLRTGVGSPEAPDQPYVFQPRADDQVAESWARVTTDTPTVGKAIGVLMRALRRRGLDLDDARASRVVLAMVRRSEETGQEPNEDWAIEEVMKP